MVPTVKRSRPNEITGKVIQSRVNPHTCRGHHSLPDVEDVGNFALACKPNQVSAIQKNGCKDCTLKYSCGKARGASEEPAEPTTSETADTEHHLEDKEMCGDDEKASQQQLGSCRLTAKSPIKHITGSPARQHGSKVLTKFAEEQKVRDTAA